MKNENIVVYLQPLVEKLQKLWKGVRTIDVTKLGSKFLLSRLHVELTRLSSIWFICRLPNKRLFSMPFMWTRDGHKMFFTLEKRNYLGHQHYLAKGHPYRRDIVTFNGQMDIRVASLKVSTIDFLRRVKEWEVWLAKRRLHASKDKYQYPFHTHGVKREKKKSLCHIGKYIFQIPMWCDYLSLEALTKTLIYIGLVYADTCQL